ncbi:multiple inositol polyphosphate phosphatase 1-like [Mytilus trossulus]|uniref:multiple inositol polyphosphate phosphatase 1-like n=1 Tax=Mytilus trossulus TaxID=6551 RepID=UPI003003FDDA
MTLKWLILIMSVVQWTTGNIMFGLPPNLFGHKVSYLWRFPNQSFDQNELMTINPNGKSCKAVQFNYVGRHAARFPSSYDFNNFEEVRNKILAHSDGSQFPFLKTWQDYPPKDSGHIEDLGRVEMHHLGDMYGNGLLDLFQGQISPSTIKLAGMTKKRTRTSASEFYKGFTKRVTGTSLSDITPIINDPVIGFFKNCPQYDVGVRNNITNLMQLHMFQNGSLFQGVLKNVTHRLGMNTTLSIDDLKEIYLLCSTGLAVRNNTAWCDILTPGDIEIINFESDLDDYYTIFIGHPLTPKISCPMWEDVFASLDNAIKMFDANQSYLLGDLRFGRSTTMDSFYAALGLFNDHKALRADNYAEMKNRLFYQAKTTTFGAHIAFILYNCGGSGPENYMLKMFVNGKPMVIPKCGSDTCQYLDVKSKYADFIKHCQWKHICSVTKPVVG